MPIGKRVKQVREHYGLTHYDFSSRLKEKENRVKSVEYGKQRAPGEFLAKVVEEFQVNAHWLLTGMGDMHAKNENILREQSPDYASDQNIAITNPQQARLIAFIEYWIKEKSTEDHIWLEGQLKRSVPEYIEFLSNQKNDRYYSE